MLKKLFTDAETYKLISRYGMIPCYKLTVQELVGLGEFSREFQADYSIGGDINLKKITRKKDGLQIMITIA